MANPMHEVLPSDGIPNAFHCTRDEKIKFLFRVGRRRLGESSLTQSGTSSSSGSDSTLSFFVMIGSSGITPGAQPRAARERFRDLALLGARLGGCSALLGSPPVRSGDKGNRTVRGHG